MPFHNSLPFLSQRSNLFCDSFPNIHSSINLPSIALPCLTYNVSAHFFYAVSLFVYHFFRIPFKFWKSCMLNSKKSLLNHVEPYMYVTMKFKVARASQLSINYKHLYTTFFYFLLHL